MITNTKSGTTLDEIANGIYRISTPFKDIPGGFTFNQYLVLDEDPLLFHTGLRHLFPIVSEAIGKVLPVEQLRYIGLSHFEADECGALNEFLAIAPQAVPLCGKIASMVSIDDVADRPARSLADGESLSVGDRTIRWVDTPHLPHAWECGFLFDEKTRTLLCGDLFTQGGSEHPPITESDILGPSEAFRQSMDYFSHSKHAGDLLERLAKLSPSTLACMHGSAWRGDGAALLRSLAEALEGTQGGA